MPKDRFPAKFATVENSILEVKESKTRLPYVHDQMPGANLAKFANMKDETIEEGEDGYLYVRVRAISSRVNKNNDGWPSEELAKSYKTFIGRPIFVDHNNEDVRRTRGVVVDARLHVDDDKQSAFDPYYSTAPDNHKPPTWIELLHEVDAKTFPELAKDIRDGKVYATSMGANIEKSVCSVCANEAVSPSQYCDHIRSKGATFEITSDNGEKIKRKAYEDCYGVNFFEDSYVFDPADETALVSEHLGHTKQADAPLITDEEDRKRNHIPQSDMVGAPAEVDTLRDEAHCKNCDAGTYQQDTDGVSRCDTCGAEQEPRPLDNPDLTKAQEVRDTTDAPADTGANQVTFDEKSEGESGSDSFIKPIEPIKPSAAVGEISDMKFATRLETDNKSEIDALLPVTAGRQEMVVGYPGGIHGGTHAAMAQAGLSGTVTYPSGNTYPLPDERANRHFGEQIRYKRENGLSDLSQVPVVLEFPDEQLGQAAAIVNQGGPVRTAATQQPKQVIKPNSKSTDQPTDQRVIADQIAPVQSKLVVKEDDMDKEADRRKIVRTEDGEGNRTEEIVEESGDLAFSDGQETPTEDEPKEESKADESEAPTDEDEDTEGDSEEKNKEKAPFQSSSASTEQRLLSAFALADEMVDTGLIQKEEKLAWVAKLEKEDISSHEARKEVIELQKKGGFKRASRLAGVQSFPRVTSATTTSASSNGYNDIPDEALFL